MAQILTWIKSPPEEVRFFECLAMRIVDKQGLARIASRFIHTKGTKYVALKTVERLIAQAKKDALSSVKRKIQSATAEQELLGYWVSIISRRVKVFETHSSWNEHIEDVRALR